MSFKGRTICLDFKPVGASEGVYIQKTKPERPYGRKSLSKIRQKKGRVHQSGVRKANRKRGIVLGDIQIFLCKRDIGLLKSPRKNYRPGKKRKPWGFDRYR